MNAPNSERRDWTLIIFIIPLGIILIIIVGQLAIRLFPNWTVSADMRSNLDPNTAPGQPASLLQPLLPQILTPMAWAESYLTPGAGEISFPPFIILEPTNTPTSTPLSPTPTTPSPISTTPSLTSTVTYTATPTDDDDEEETPSSPPATCQNHAATNYGDPLPCVFSPPTCQDNTATNYGDPLPCTYPSTMCEDEDADNYGDPLPCTFPPTICEDEDADNYGDPLPCTFPSSGYPSTPDPSWTLVSDVPVEINTDTPDDNIATLENGNYIVLDFSGNPIYVSLTNDNYYDLVFYESQFNSNVLLDHIIIGISNDSNGYVYYEVFNWGNGIPDNNSNVGSFAGTESDNQPISSSELYDPDGAGSAPQTGVLIDVDNATSQPPPGTYYNYVVIISPNSGSGDPSQIDAVVVTEVPIPTP